MRGHFVLKSKKEKSGSKILWNLFYLEKKPLRNCWNMFWLHGVLDLVESDSAVSMIPRRDLNMGISPRNLNHIWKHFSTWVGRTDGLESREGGLPSNETVPLISPFLTPVGRSAGAAGDSCPNPSAAAAPQPPPPGWCDSPVDRWFDSAPGQPLREPHHHFGHRPGRCRSSSWWDSWREGAGSGPTPPRTEL